MSPSLLGARGLNALAGVGVLMTMLSCAPGEVGPAASGGRGGAGPVAADASVATGGSVATPPGSGGNGSGGDTTGTGGGVIEGSGGVSGSGGSGTGGAQGTGGLPAGATGGGAGGRGGRGSAGGGGTAGAGRTGGAGGQAPSGGACPPAALVCEDFEDRQAQGWSALAGGMTIDTQHASSGTNAVLLNIPAGQRGGFISRKGAPLFPLLNKTMWGRVMLWFDAVADGHTDIVRAQSAAGGNPAYNLAEQHGDYMLNYYNGSAATDCWARPKSPTPTKLPLGKWSCWEWKFDSGTNSIQFFVDGTLYRAVAMTGDGCLSGNGVWAAPPEFGTVSVGAYIAEVGGAMKMWFDDIAIGTQERIGCPTP